MNILLTGANGFLGKYIHNELKNYGNVDSVSRSNSTINTDISVNKPVLIDKYDLVIHSAGKAHSVPKTLQEKKEFFDINVTGLINLLKALEKSAIPQSFVFISTVAVYGKETGTLVKEDTDLLATDAYGKSKIEAEKITQEWCKINNVICTILRLPLIAGTKPPGNLKSMINGIKKGYYFNVAGGKARKSIVLAEDVAKIIPIASKTGGIYNLTDQKHPSFLDLSLVIARQLNKAKPLNVPIWFVRLLAKAGDVLGGKAPINSDKLRKIISDLTFDDTKAQKILNWNPTPVLRGFKIE